MLLFIIGFVLGANMALILYACVLAGKNTEIYLDEIYANKEVLSEWGKQS